MPLRIPHPDAPLHLYRHILREASYLPPLARPWAVDRIKARFRDCRHARHPDRHVRHAHHHLRFLRAANAGHVDRMLRICYMATGRLGKRRRLLADAYLTTAPPPDSPALALATPQSPGKRPGGDRLLHPTWLDSWDLPKIKALAKSQYDQQSNATLPKEVRRTLNVSPTQNCWGLPVGPRGLTNKTKKLYASVFASLLPPVPRGEWQALQSLALGEADDASWQIPSRRPVAASTTTTTANTATGTAHVDRPWDWEKYATTPIRVLERPNARRRKALSGSLDQDPRGQGAPIGLRAYKPRSLRRNLYGRIWAASPLVTTKNTSWDITWGGANPKVSKPASRDMQFFRGVDTKGSIMPSSPGHGLNVSQV
ncbi:uncharacterized protein JN550_013287 [Neoarthrinium moseri]|uniref:uncharacterized protein n=1 Tax=Neoarthrinium moseri TaxID=1658444 RepID=UPI001FDDB3A5|nr:uncharacterized protein JN550_013287 [Neoarthrinium moseri]KAI1857307.1 hypothetical protein JN550_013287 [Neoarthrinium moseri]